MLKLEIVRPDGCNIVVEGRLGQPILHLLFEADVSRGRFMCAGAGLCGKCRVRFLSSPPPAGAEEAARLKAVELESGWRLACKHVLLESCRIEVPTQIEHAWSEVRGDSLAVDIGTTRIKWAVGGDAVPGREFAMANPQMGVGAEVMSRLRYALSSPAGKAQLRASVLDVLQRLVAASGASALAVAGNSVMMSLLADAPLEGLAYAPYALGWTGGTEVSLDARLPMAYVPPLLGPFIGADISAGLARIVFDSPRYPFLLADLGTNGEFVLAVDPDHFYACSVPMGPAIEGVGLCCGAVAGPGVLGSVTLGQKGLQWAEEPLTGISGAGYVSLFALLRRLGILAESGHFQPASMPLARSVAARVREEAVGRVLGLDDGVFVAERDIEEFLKAKAGVNVALSALVECAGMSEGDVSQVYLAGALGEYSQVGDFITLGFFPESWREKIIVAGNTSLGGTMLALRRPEVREWLAGLPRKVSVQVLVERVDFGARFLQAMRFAWL